MRSQQGGMPSNPFFVRSGLWPTFVPTRLAPRQRRPLPVGVHPDGSVRICKRLIDRREKRHVAYHHGVLPQSLHPGFAGTDPEREVWRHAVFAEAFSHDVRVAHRPAVHFQAEALTSNHQLGIGPKEGIDFRRSSSHLVCVGLQKHASQLHLVQHVISLPSSAAVYVLRAPIPNRHGAEPPDKGSPTQTLKPLARLFPGREKPDPGQHGRRRRMSFQEPQHCSVSLAGHGVAALAAGVRVGRHAWTLPSARALGGAHAAFARQMSAHFLHLHIG